MAVVGQLRRIRKFDHVRIAARSREADSEQVCEHHLQAGAGYLRDFNVDRVVTRQMNADLWTHVVRPSCQARRYPIRPL